MIEQFLGYAIAFFILFGIAWTWLIGPVLYVIGALDFLKGEEETVEETVEKTPKTQKLKGRNVPIVSEYDPKYEL